MNLDRLIIEFDKGLRTVLAPAHSVRPLPDRDQAETSLSAQEKRRAAALMRVNHSGEVCAQALYAAQALGTRDAALRFVSRAQPSRPSSISEVETDECISCCPFTRMQ